jgi:signal transduction histidine kinase
MPRPSLRLCLAALWVFILGVAIALAAVIYEAYEQGPGSQIRHARLSAEKACTELATKFSWGEENKSYSLEKKYDFQYALLEIILEHYEGVEGGYWNSDKTFGPYAYPTYEGNGIKRDIPESERPTLNLLANQATLKHALQSELKRGNREGIYYTACPLSLVANSGAAWTMIRIPLSTGFAYSKFQWSLSLIFVFIIISGIGLGLVVYRWIRNVRSLEREILQHSVDNLPPLNPNPELELNRIVDAINQLNSRFQASKAETKKLERKIAHNDRLSALGKMAAEMAHEIRNPLATISLKLENALVDPASRLPLAAPIIYAQIGRMDRLINMLLAMTQQFEIKAQTVDIQDWVSTSFLNIRKNAESKKVSLLFDFQVERWSFDPFHLARALENLLSNAIAFTAIHGQVRVSFFKEDSNLIIIVEDEGPGISAQVRDTLFEPFKSHRVDGNGLGLVLVDDIVKAHGGSIEEIGSSSGALFRMEIPWQKS